MRIALLTLLLISNLCHSQSEVEELKFDKKYFDAVDHWVAFPKTDAENTYYYGFIYIDEQAGFTYHLGSTFSIDSLNNFIPEPIDSLAQVKYRIDQNWGEVGIIPKNKLSDLKLPAEPDWLQYYKVNSDEVSYLKNIGYHYNHVGASQLALQPLLEAYEKEPHFDGLEFELSYAYNALKQFEKAIEVLDKAIENDPSNYYFYRELGYAYKYLDRIDDAEKTYRLGIKISDNDFEKSEMAVNMAQSYFHLRNREKFDEWAKLTRQYAEEGSRYAQFIDLFEQEWDKE